MKEYGEKTDQVLVELTLLGNEQAFSELVTRHEKAVKGTAFKVTQNPWSAEDAAQDAFVSAWMQLDALNDRSRFGSWVCAIAKNCARDLVIHYRNTVPDISLQIPDEGDLPDAAFAKEEEKRELHDAVGTLTEKIRDVVRLHYFEGYSVDEIAARLSLPAGTVKWRLSEGRKQLRKGYGIVEKEYNENETLLARVMRQVEELKLWRLKSDMSGFEETYRRVLENAKALDESKEKQHALADIRMMGYRWVPGMRCNETFEKIKQSALEGHNEDVMQQVVAVEMRRHAPKEEYLRKIVVPFLEENGFVKALAYAWFWYGMECIDAREYDKTREALRHVVELLDPTCVYYANAHAVFEVLDRVEKAKGRRLFGWDATGETLRWIGGKLYFWDQPGTSRGPYRDTGDSLLWNCEGCDSLIWDPNAKPGETIVSSSGKETWTLLETDRTVDTPAGTFSGCRVVKTTGDRNGTTDVETAFCFGVGIVWQRTVVHGFENVWRLSRYSLKGGEGAIPLAVGNRWEYVVDRLPDDIDVREYGNVYEVFSFENGKAILSSSKFYDGVGYRDNWAGKMKEVQATYWTEEDANGDEHLVDVETPLRRAEELAATKRQKIHTAVAADVVRRIFRTDPEFNPDYTEKGRWNFFEMSPVTKKDGKPRFSWSERHVEWKDMGSVPWAESQPLLGDLYSILQDAAGAAWSDEWKVGYRLKDEEAQMYGYAFRRSIEVFGDETVETPAGVFTGCRHVAINAANYPVCGTYYRSGKMEAWYAPGVGLVQYSRPMDGVPENVWQLTAYKGTGEGFFPVGDGFFRHYEPRKIAEGWRASVEYTFDEDESGIVCFRNTLGVQDRAHYEAALKKKEEEKGKK